MKKIFLFMLVLSAIYQSKAQDYYYYKNEKVNLTLQRQSLYILCSMSNAETLQKKLHRVGTVNRFSKDIFQRRLKIDFSNAPGYLRNESNSYAEIQLSSDLTEEKFYKLIEEIKAIPEIINVSFIYKNSRDVKITVSNYLWVQMKDTTQIKALQEYASTIDYVIMGQNKQMPNWVMLGAKKGAKMNVLNASAYFYESGLYVSSEPDYYGKAEIDCVNDTFYPMQWALNQATFSGVPIGLNSCAAWNLTTGNSNVDVAIIDEGFENNHPDLNDNLANNGYDTKTATTPTVVYGSHGTSCAGIVAAEGNNSQGVAGVAYNADLMSVSLDFDNMTWAEISDGYLWAMNNGAEVLSNSWGWDSPSGLFDATVWTLLLNGRSLLGCVIVFSAGNINSSSLIYPKNSNLNLIITGATSWCLERKNPSSCDGENWWGSNYGAGLDVMAPGVGIPTTDRQGSNGYNTMAGNGGNYAPTFNGTSSACPHAAGVAALILSINPCLTQTQVQQIMSETSRKVGGYSYTTTAANPYGTWNNEMGYGLLDAQAAVIKASSYYLQNLTVTGTTSYKRPLVLAGFDVNPSLPTGNFTTTPTANVTIQASVGIEFKAGCDLRGTVHAQIANIGACSTW